MMFIRLFKIEFIVVYHWWRDSAVYYYSRNYIMGEFINLWNFMYWTWEIFQSKTEIATAVAGKKLHSQSSQSAVTQSDVDREACRHLL